MIAFKIDNSRNAAGFLFDGFPRTVSQTIALEKMLNERGMKIDSMLVLDVDHDELVKRLIARAEISGRPDDKDPAVIENRIDVYKDKTEPIIEYCRERGIYQPVNGMGTIEDIFGRLSGYMKKLNLNSLCFSVPLCVPLCNKKITQRVTEMTQRATEWHRESSEKIYI